MPPAHDYGADQEPDAARYGAVAFALQIDEGEPDQPAGESAEQDHHEGDDAGGDGRDRREGT